MLEQIIKKWTGYTQIRKFEGAVTHCTNVHPLQQINRETSMDFVEASPGSGEPWHKALK